MSRTKNIDARAAKGAPDGIEKRRHPRTAKYGAQKLNLTYRDSAGSNRRASATLWDFSEGGLGMESAQPIPIDEIISIRGDLRSPDLSMSLEAQARVAYCRKLDSQNYRIGVAFVTVKFSRLGPGDGDKA